MAAHDSRQSALRTPYAKPEEHGTLFCRLFNDPVRYGRLHSQVIRRFMINKNWLDRLQFIVQSRYYSTVYRTIKVLFYSLSYNQGTILQFIVNQGTILQFAWKDEEHEKNPHAGYPMFCPKHLLTDREHSAALVGN